MDIQLADPKYVEKKKQDSGNITYIYSDGHVKARHRKKLKTLLRLAKTIKSLRRKVAEDLDDPDRGEIAMVVALIDETYERVGNPDSAKENHFGVTTWRKKHVSFPGSKAVIRYKGKAGVDQEKTVTSKRVVSLLKGLVSQRKADEELFPQVIAADVNAYLKPFGITAKDIRGFHANEEMKKALSKAKKKGGDEKQRKEEFKAALEETAKRVGHDPGTLKKDYLVPSFEENYLERGRIGAKKSASADKENFRMVSRTTSHTDRMLAIRKLAGKGKKKQWEHDSAMLAIMAPPGVVRRLKKHVDQDTVSPDGLHMTLLFLGKVADLDKPTMKAIQRAAEKVCARHRPLAMRVSGAGRFAPGEDGTPVYIVPNAKGLSALQADLESAVGSIIDLPSEHGWVPHMTVGYACDDNPALPDLEAYPEWTAREVRFQAGGKTVADLPLGTRKTASEVRPLGELTDEEQVYVGPLEQQTEENDYYRQVLFTGNNSQLVLMSLKPGEDIGEEVHKDTDQFFRVDKGEGKAVLNGVEYPIEDGSGVLVPSGTHHNVVNTGKGPLKLYTVYSPPHHGHGEVRKTKEDAEKAEKRDEAAQAAADRSFAAPDFVDRMIRLAEQLDDGGDHDGAERLCRQLDLLISRRAHFVPSDKTEAPPMWRKNLDYGEDSPYYGSVKDFLKKYPGGLGEYIRKRRKSRKSHERKWKLSALAEQDWLEQAVMDAWRQDEIQSDLEDLMGAAAGLRTVPHIARMAKLRQLSAEQEPDDDPQEIRDDYIRDPQKAPREFVKYWSILLKDLRKRRQGRSK